MKHACWHLKLCLLDLLKMLDLGLSQIYSRINKLVEVYRFRQCLGWRFLPISTFFSLVSSRTLSEAAHSRFRCGDPKLCLPRFSRMLLLALFQISNVYFTCGSALQCLGGYFKPCQFTFPSLFLFSRALSYAAQSNFWCRS